MRFTSILVPLLLLSVPLRSQERFFYTGKDYGSEALYNPLSLLLNGSYDIIQLAGHTRDVVHVSYSAGFSNVLRNLGSPFGPISRYGWGKFLSREIFPLHWTKGEGQWWPNYQLHLIGGGMTYTAMREWYEMHGFDAPALWSAGTMAAYHLLNEVVENGPYRGDNVDPISDIYVFDIGGVILFSFDGINRFFSRELHLADWSMQPGFSLVDGTLQNNGQYFSLKWQLPFSESLHFFYYFGMRGLFGLSEDLGDGNAISVGAGPRAVQLKTLDPATNLKSVEMRWSVGIFYDRNNSLLTSLFWSDYSDDWLSLNIYPGVLRLGDFSPGAWLVFNRTTGTVIGISTVWFPGVACNWR